MVRTLFVLCVRALLSIEVRDGIECLPSVNCDVAQRIMHEMKKWGWINDVNLGLVQLLPLASVDLRNCPLSPQTLTNTASKWRSNLEGLNLAGIQIGDEFIQGLSMSDAARTIKELNLCNTFITDASLSQLHLFPSLRKLKLRDCADVSDKGVEWIAGCCPSLEHLDLSYTTVTYRALEILSQHPQQQPTQHPQQLSQHQPQPIQQPQQPLLPKLRVLKLTLSEDIQSEIVTKFLEGRGEEDLRRFEILSLFPRALKSDSEILHRIISNCPNLRVFNHVIDDPRKLLVGGVLTELRKKVTLNLTRTCDLAAIDWLGQRLPYLESMEIDTQWRGNFIPLFPSFANLRDLTIHQLQLVEKVPRMPKLNFTGLNGLALRQVTFTTKETFKQLTRLENLTKLIIDTGTAYDITGEDVSFVLNSLKNLRHVEIVNFCAKDLARRNIPLLSIGLRNPALTAIVFITSNHLELRISEAPSLTRLECQRLANCDQLLRDLEWGAPSLVDLKIGFWEPIAFSALQPIPLKLFLRLREFEVDAVFDSEVDWLALLPVQADTDKLELRRLMLRDIRSTDDGRLQPIFAKAQHLQQLDIAKTRLKFPSLPLTGLTTLNLYDCWGIKGDFVVHNQFSSLVSLSLISVPDLSRIEAEGMPFLRIVHIESVEALETLVLSDLPRVKSISISMAQRLHTITLRSCCATYLLLEDLSSLTDLNAVGVEDLTLLNASGLSMLKEEDLESLLNSNRKLEILRTDKSTLAELSWGGDHPFLNDVELI